MWFLNHLKLLFNSLAVIFNYFLLAILSIKVHIIIADDLYTARYVYLYSMFDLLEPIIFFLVVVYNRYFIRLLMEPEINPMFFHFIKFFNNIYNIKLIGIISTLNNLFLKGLKLWVSTLDKYWQFRYELNPFKYNLFYKVVSIFDKTIKNLETDLNNKEEDDSDEWMSKFEWEGNFTHMEFIKKMQVKNDKKVWRKKTRNKVDIEHGNTTTVKLLKKKNESSEFELWVKMVNKLPINSFTKLTINLVRILFLTLDVFCVFFIYFTKIILLIQWRPLNIRLPYFKKISSKVTEKKKNKFTITKIKTKTKRGSHYVNFIKQ